METVLINNEVAGRFEAEVDGFLAVLEYELADKTMTLVHTEVPKELEGRGLGSKIVKFALEYARAHGLKLAPKCPFVRSYIDRHEEYQKIVSE